MSHIFISYSRKDIEFAGKIVEALAENNFEMWIDWKSIPKGEDWEQEIYRGIEEADAFLFLISPDSAKSEMCNKEIAHAVENNKRILPIVLHDTDVNAFLSELAKNEISKRNWVFCRVGKDNFEKTIEETQTTIHTDYDWVQAHRRLQVKALEWERNHKENSFILRGRDLQDAELQLATNSSKEPYPTDLQREYVFESRKAADRQRRTITWISIAGIIALTALAVFGFVQAGIATTNEKQAEERANIARAGELAAVSVSHRDKQDLSLLLSIEAFKTFDTIQTRSLLLENTLSNAQVIQYLQPSNPLCFLCGTRNVAFDKETGNLAWADTNCEIGVGCQEDSIFIWSNTTKKSLEQKLPSGFGFVSNLKFSPDGNFLALGGCERVNSICDSYKVIFWDTINSRAIGKPLSVASYITALSFSPDGKSLITSTTSKTILWDIEFAPRIIQSFTGNVAAFNPKETTFAIGNDNGTIDFWDLKTLKIVDQIPTPAEKLYDLSFSLDGKLLFIKSGIGEVFIWNIDKRQITIPLKEAPPIQHDVATAILHSYHDISPDGKVLAYGENDVFRLWDIETKKVIYEITEGYTGWVEFFFFSPNSKLLVTINNDDSMILWETENSQPIAENLEISSKKSTNKMVLNSNDQILAVSDKNNIILWDILSRHPLGQPLAKYNGEITSLAFSPDGKILASSSDDGTINLWDTNSLQPIDPPLIGDYTVGKIAFRSDGKYIVSAACPVDTYTTKCLGIEVITWDLKTHQALRKSVIWSNRFNPAPIDSWVMNDNGELLASNVSGNIFLWNLLDQQAEPQPIAEIQGYEGAPYVFDSDGKTLALGICGGYSIFGCNQIKIMLFDTLKKEFLEQPFEADTTNGNVNHIVFSPDRKFLASVLSNDIILFDSITHQMIGQPIPSNSPPITVIFSENGKMLITNDYSGNIILWDINPEAWVDILCQRVGRNFSRKEWARYFPNEEYRKTCEQFPVEPEVNLTPTAAQ